MKIWVDENIPAMTVNALRELGHDVKDIRGTTDEGLADVDVWEMAQQEHRLLVTTVKGFSQYRESDYAGILIIRLKQPNRKEIHRRVLKALNQYPEREWRGRIVMMKDVVQSTWRFRGKK